ncbi:MAG: endonuclease/exonuclease/phosphatase family protein [Pirellulaceae bacterium]
MRLDFLLSLFSLLLIWLLPPNCSLATEPNTRILTYNIRYLNTNDGEDVWSNRSQAVIETISDAELVGLQEVVAQQLDDIRAGTSHMEWYGVGRDDGKQKGEMTPIGWDKQRFAAERTGTFWLSRNPGEVGKKSWDAALPRIASWAVLRRRSDQARLLLVNTHFDHIGQEARQQSARLIRKWIFEHRQIDGTQLPAILLGDLNASLGQPPLDELLVASKQDSLPLKDAMSITATPAVGPTGTWNGFKAIAENSRIDHVLVLGDVRVERYQTLDPRTEQGRFASDHLPIAVEVAY